MVIEVFRPKKLEFHLKLYPSLFQFHSQQTHAARYSPRGGGRL